MSNYTTGETTDLFDFSTGRWVGVVDKQGRETLVPTATTDPLTGGNNIVAGTSTLQLPAGVSSLGDPSPSIYLNIAAHGERNNNTWTVTGGQGRAISRRRMDIYNPTSSVRVLLQNRFITTSGETNGPAGVVIVGAALELGSTTYPLTFNGAAGTTMAAGDVEVLSDPLAVTLKKGDRPWIRLLIDATTAGSFCNDGISDTGEQYIVYAPANENNQIYGNGTLTNPTGGSATFGFGATALLGLVPSSSVAILGIGDSIADGLHDIAGSGVGTGGMYRRLGKLTETPVFSYTIPGKSLASITSNNSALAALCKYHTHAQLQLGTNDANGSNIGTMQTNYTTAWAFLKTNLSGKKHVAQHTLMPRLATPTDGVTTLVNQVPATGFANNGQRDQLNFYFNTNVISRSIDLVIDTGSAVADKTEPSKWALRTFTTTLGGAYAGGSNVSLNALPVLGEELVISPTATPSTGANAVRSFTGTTAPFTTTLTAAPGGSFALSTAVSATPSIDGIHPSAALYQYVILPMMVAQTPVH